LVQSELLALEGDSKVTFFDGNFSEFEDWRRQILGDAGTRRGKLICRSFEVDSPACPRGTAEMRIKKIPTFWRSGVGAVRTLLHHAYAWHAANLGGPPKADNHRG